MDQIKLRAAELEVELTPAIGGRISQIRHRQCASFPDLLIDKKLWESRARARTITSSGIEGPGSSDTGSLQWGCYPMAPWPGRIADGRFSFEGNSFTLPANFGSSAIHGTAFAEPWTVVSSSEREADLEYPLGEAWPWRGKVRQSVEVSENVLALTLEIHAEPGQRFPAGAGWHPWFSRRGGNPRVEVKSSEYFETDEELIPTGRLVRVHDSSDLTESPTLDDRRLDQVYANPIWPIAVEWHDLRIEISASTNASCVCLYTPPEGFCIEPMTCAANAFNAGGDARAFGAAVVDSNSPLIVRSWMRFWPR